MRRLALPLAHALAERDRIATAATEAPAPTVTPSDPAEPPHSGDVAVGGHAGAQARDLLDAATQRGQRLLAQITRAALARTLKDGPAGLLRARRLLSDAERDALTAGLASILAPANLLGRARIRGRLTATPFADNALVPMPPEKALAYFQALVPALGVDPQRFGTDQRRRAFTLAVATEKSLLDRVKGIITAGMDSGADTGSLSSQVQTTLDKAGIGATRNGYAAMVVRTNIMESLNQGQTEEMQDPDVAEAFPVWRYDGIEDGREGADHRPHFGQYYPNDVAFSVVRGKRIFNCRCGQSPVDAETWAELQAKGAKLASGYSLAPATAKTKVRPVSPPPQAPAVSVPQSPNDLRALIAERTQLPLDPNVSTLTLRPEAAIGGGSSSGAGEIKVPRYIAAAYNSALAKDPQDWTRDEQQGVLTVLHEVGHTVGNHEPGWRSPEEANTYGQTSRLVPSSMGGPNQVRAGVGLMLEEATNEAIARQTLADLRGKPWQDRKDSGGYQQYIIGLRDLAKEAGTTEYELAKSLRAQSMRDRLATVGKILGATTEEESLAKGQAYVTEVLAQGNDFPPKKKGFQDAIGALKRPQEATPRPAPQPESQATPTPEIAATPQPQEPQPKKQKVAKPEPLSQPEPIKETPAPVARKQFKTVQEAEEHLDEAHNINLSKGRATSEPEFLKQAEHVNTEMDRMRARFKIAETTVKRRGSRNQSLELATEFTGDEKNTAGKYRYGEGIQMGNLPVDEKADPVFGQHTVGTDLGTCYRHEFGHEVYNTTFSGAKQREWNRTFDKYVGTSTVSRYGGTNTSELFSESFAAYTSPNYKRGTLPADLEAWLDKNVKGGK